MGAGEGVVRRGRGGGVGVWGFFFNDTATTEIYTLSLHDALPILRWRLPLRIWRSRKWCPSPFRPTPGPKRLD